MEPLEVCGKHYRLVAFTKRIGMTVDSGHYLAYVRPAGDRWYLFDDEARPVFRTQ